MVIRKFLVVLSLLISASFLFGFHSNNEKEFTYRSDQFLKENWAYNYLKIDNIREKYNVYGKGIKVGLIDTGVSNFIEVTNGINILSKKSNYYDDHGHGTHIAGILKDKEFGIIPDSELFVVKALDNKMEGEIDNIVLGINWLIKQDVDIILLPLGSPSGNEELKKVINKAIRKEIFVVSSVGNFGLQEKSEVLYPAKYKNVIGVGALAKDGDIWRGTTLGRGVDILLPGQFIKSVSLKGEPLISSGTSMASAYMAGMLALYIEKLNSEGYPDEEGRILQFNEILYKFTKNGCLKAFDSDILFP